MRVHIHCCLSVFLFLVVIASPISAQEEQSVIIKKIESGNSKALQEWVQLSCVGSYRAVAHSAILGRGEEHLVITVDSPNCDHFAIVLFRRSSTSLDEWTYVDTIKLPSGTNSVPRVQFADFAQKGINEIYVSGMLTDSGSGITQRGCIILKLINGRLMTVFNGTEFVSLDGQDVRVLQKSYFTIHDSETAGISGFKFLREERTVEVNNHRVRRIQNCFWDQDIHHFTCVEGTTVAAARASTTH